MQPLEIIFRKLTARPLDDGRRHGMEIGQRLLDVGDVMVVVAAHDRTLELIAHDANALRRRRVVAHHVSHGDIIRHTLLTRIGQHRFQCVDVGVNVAEYGVDLGHVI